MTLGSSFAWTILSVSPEYSAGESWDWMVWGYIYLLQTSCKCESTGSLFCMLNCGAGRDVLLLAIPHLFFDRSIYFKNLNFSIDLFFLKKNKNKCCIGVLNVFGCLYTQITAKMLSLLVTRKLRQDLLLNVLGKAQNMKER